MSASRLTALTLTVCLLSAGVHAKKADDAAAPPAPPLWRVSDADSSVYLFGAIGLSPQGAAWRTRDIARAIDTSETIWFEVPVDEPWAQAAANRIFAADGMLTPGDRLSSHLPDEAAESLGAIAAAAGLSLETLEPLKPWAAFVVLSARAQLESDEPAVETAILTEARSRGRQLRYFGTVEDSLRLLTDMTGDQQSRLASHLIGDFNRQRETARAGFEAWRTGDLAAADAFLNGTMRAQSPDIFQRLVSDRAAAIATDIAAILKSPETAFISLNASYVVGPDALPDRLAELGFRIERIGAPADD